MKMIEKLVKDIKENKVVVVCASLTILVFAAGIQIA